MIKEIKKWLKENDFDVNVGRDDIFCYCFFDNKIGIPGKIDLSHASEYIKYCKHLGLKNSDIDYRSLAFLHELGHSETLEYANDFLCRIDNFMSKFLDVPSNTVFERNIRCNLYYRLYSEKIATKWAIDYINYNKDKVNQLKDIL